jgi:hypothetical protein
MTTPFYLSQEQLAETLFGVHDLIENTKPHVLDRRQMPWFGMISKMKAEIPFIRNQLVSKYKSEADELDMQIWYGQDRLGFQEWREGFDLVDTGTQVHMGLKLEHQELKDNGYVILPNGSRSGSIASRNSKAQSLALIDTLSEKLESARDRWDVLMDQKFLHNMSGNPLEPIALTDFISKTPTVGTVSGRSRSNPEMQNIASLAMTPASFERDMNLVCRQAMLFNRGWAGAGINVWMASGGWIDRYSAALKDSSNGFRMTTGVKGPGPIDIGIADTEWAFKGIPVVYNPTMDLMAQLTGDATWNRRAYGLNTKTMKFYHAPKEDKLMTVPLDPADQRVTRISYDGRYMFRVQNLRSNAVVEFAA